MMDKFIYGAGIVFLIIVGIIILWCFCTWLLYTAETFRENKSGSLRIEQSKRIGSDICSAANYFSAYPEIYNTLKLIGSDLKEYQHFDPGGVRTKVILTGKNKLK